MEQEQNMGPTLESGSSNYLKAVLFAFAFGLIGVALWVLIGALTSFISAWIALVIALGIRGGYEKAKGPKKLKIITLIVIYVVQIFISIHLMYFFILRDIGLNVGLFEVWSVVNISEDLATLIIFPAIGLVIFFLSSFGRNNRQAINEGAMVARPGNRFSQFVPFSGDFQRLSQEIDALLTENKYEPTPYGEEEGFFRAGDGVWVASKYFRAIQADGGVTVEAFVIMSGKEHGIEGFAGTVAKKPLKKLVDQVKEKIQAFR